MATIQNERDLILQAAPERLLPYGTPNLIVQPGQVPGLPDAIAATKGVHLSAPSNVFQIAPNGAASPASITLTATLTNVSGAVTWTILAGDAALTGSGNTRTLAAADMMSPSVTIRAAITHEGIEYTADYTIVKTADGQPGTNGLPGSNTAMVYAYQRAAAAPSASPGEVTWTFNLGAITAPASLPNGWHKSIPAGADPLWITVAVATSTTNTDTIGAGEWTAPTILAEHGVDGASVDMAFRRGATQPATPSASASTPSGWYATVDAVPSGADPIWSSVGTRTSPTGNWTWQAPIQMQGTDGEPGDDGADGLSVATVWLFTRSDLTSPPAVPAGTLTYTFATGQLSGTLDAWSQTVPLASGKYLWVTTAAAAGSDATYAIASGTWATPRILATDGETGQEGLRGSLTVYATLSNLQRYADRPSSLAKWSSGSPTSGNATLADNAARDAVWQTLGNPGSAPNNSHLRLGDTVTLTNSAGTATATGYWGGASWLDPGTVIDGNLLVNGSVTAESINSWGLSIYTPTGVLVLDASRRLQRSDLTDLGVLAALNSLALGDPQLTGFGALAGQNTVNLGSQVTGALAHGNVSGLGALALLNVVDLNTQTTGALNGLTQVTNLGTLAYANAIAANQIGAGTLSAGVVYAGDISAGQVIAGTFTGLTFRTTASTSGQQVVISAATNDIQVRAGGIVRLTLGGAGGSGYLFVNKGPELTPGIYVQGTAGAAGIYSTMSGGTEAIGGNASGGAIGVAGRSSGTGPGVRATNSNNGVAMDAQATSSSSGHTQNHGMRGQNTRLGSSGLVGATTGHAFYSEAGGYGPFTGSHDALVPNGEVSSLQPGDIVVDGSLIDAQGVDDVLQLAELSDAEGQAGAIGVVSRVLGPLEDFRPAACIVGMDPESGQPYMSAAWVAHASTHTLIAVNALGEGQIAVCGRGGDLARGDLIICSDMPGKGQKQPDDVIRSRTVARARVAVTFSHPDEVRLVPCIYLCG